jgi:hypothetical protein
MFFRKLIDGVIVITGNMAGILVFYTCKILARIMNLRKPSYRISPDTAKSLKYLFAGMQLDDVTVVYNAWLPAHIFNKSIEGMTFRNMIYITHGHTPQHYASLMLLIHELVHIRQILDLGEAVFACQYGAQFLRNRGYGAGMQLENEAYTFVEKIIKEEDFNSFKS